MPQKRWFPSHWPVDTLFFWFLIPPLKKAVHHWWILQGAQRNFGLGWCEIPLRLDLSWCWYLADSGMLDGTVGQFFYGEFSKKHWKKHPSGTDTLVQVLVIEWALVMYFIRCEWELVHTIKQLSLLLRLTIYFIFVYDMNWYNLIYLWCITVSSKGCCLKPKGCYMGTPLSSIQYFLEDPGVWYHSWISQIQTAVAFSFRLGCPAQCSPRLREQEN